MSTLEQTYREQRAPLMRHIAKRIGSAQSAEDIAQEMFLRFMQSREGNDIREPAAYLRTIASHVMYEQRMRQAREPVIFDSNLADALAQFIAEPSDSQLEENGPEQRLRSVLRTLPRLHVSIVKLRHVAGMSLPEIAYMLDISVHSVKKYLASALARCRAQGRPLIGSGGPGSSAVR